ncbi:MAG: zinc ribbon domain-containing protein [Gemmatimonadetes bacterium]|nr:zinc ribbon domain-containing protein [Gemmatimonadota bacterium]
MPMTRPEDFGTDETGCRVNDYCHYCFAAGSFTEPRVTMQQMLNRCVAILARQQHMPEEEAHAVLSDVLPGLKRWRQPAVR